MDRNSGQKSASQVLYPPLDPFDQRMLPVGEGHELYVEQSGNPEGEAVVVLHGGPGGGCSPAMRRYFDPDHYRIILFDQRGCGRSRPYASVEDNTTWHLVRDIEKIRETLGIETWCVFGGSWGATLSLLYAQTHPDRVRHLALRGVFLMTQAELDWFYGGGAGKFWPEAWARFTDPIPEAEHDDFIAAYARRLFTGNQVEEVRFARAWSVWENGLASVASNGMGGEPPGQYARAFARLENHYFTHLGWIEEGQILRDMDRIAHIPGDIVQGRFDMICPPAKAWELHRAWPHSELHMIPHAGHALSEPGITARLVQVMGRRAKA
ncbi:prolyl aminopeptidase [Oceanicola sp. S124]|uniref:prolyl aminopeptidase n=1 Tax=Oceanicola sp. S124 TaxID=1042378 RepID=UPI0002E4C4EF|nr:prolyl aminopeptidase [Oceanicola sp. S124]